MQKMEPGVVELHRRGRQEGSSLCTLALLLVLLLLLLGLA